ncbi:MAG: (Fe-S)-binding protein [Candidatus Bathyarchaeota archaeon]
MDNPTVCVVVPSFAHEGQTRLKEVLSRYLGSLIEVLEVASLSEEDVINTIAEFTLKAKFSIIIVLSFLEPLTVKNIKNMFSMPTYSLDNAMMEVAGAYINERIVVLLSSEEEEKIFSLHKPLYEVTPKQIMDVKVESSPEKVADTIIQLYNQGYNKFFLGSVRLITDFDRVNEFLLEKIGVRKDLNLINPCLTFAEFLSQTGRGLKISSYEISKILPCIADPTKIRVVAKFNTSIDKLLPLLYLNIKNSRYNDALETLTFTTKDEEMITIYGSGKVCMGKVRDEEKAKKLLKMLMETLNKAYNYYTVHGVPPDEAFNLRSKLSPMLVYNHLPKLDCKVCGEETCYVFAFKLLSGERKLEECKPLYVEGRRRDREFLEKIVNPIF